MGQDIEELAIGGSLLQEGARYGRIWKEVVRGRRKRQDGAGVGQVWQEEAVG